MNETPKCHYCKRTHSDKWFCEPCFQQAIQGAAGKFRRAVYKKHGYKCAACGTTDRDVLTIDHIDPNGDRFDVDNTQILCANDHMKKNKGKLKIKVSV